MKLICVPAKIGATGEVESELSKEDLRREVVDDKNIVIFKSVFSRDQMDSIKQKFHEYGLQTPASLPAVEYGVSNYHRFDDDPVKAAVKRRMHFYSVFYWNPPQFNERDFLFPALSLQKQVSDLPADFAKDRVDQGYLCSGRVSHYPKGGGYYATHTDPTELEKCSIILSMSTKGVDYKQGGLYVLDDGKIIDVEGQLESGDLIVFDQSIKHGVAPIDPDEALDWKKSEGRWMMFSTIVHHDTYKGNFEKAAKST